MHTSAVRYLRYLDKYCEYRRFDTSMKEVSIYCGATILPSIMSFRDMTIPVSMPCNRSIVDNCTLHDSQVNKTSHQNHSCRPKLVICLQFADALISVLSRRPISSSIVAFSQLSWPTRGANNGCAVQRCARCMRYIRWPMMKFCAVCHALFIYLNYTGFC